MSPGTLSFRYDDLGNRTERTFPGEGTTSYHYDAATNRLSWSAGSGSLPVGMTLSWTPAERIRETSDGAVYTHDGLGRRVAKQLAAEMIDLVYHYDVSGRLHGGDEAGRHARARVLLRGRPARGRARLSDGSTCPAATSRSGTTRTTREASALARTSQRNGRGRVAYQPWGETPATSAMGGRLFDGRPRDTGMGFSDLGARCIAPKIGRFVSADPKWTAAAIPRYSEPVRVRAQQPLKHTDAGGESPLLAITTMLLWDGQAPVPVQVAASARDTLLADGDAFIADQTEVQRIWRQVLDGEITLAKASDKFVETGNAYEGVTAAGRKQSKFAQEVIAEVEEGDVTEEGVQGFRLFWSTLAGDPVKTKAEIGDRARAAWHRHRAEPHVSAAAAGAPPGRAGLLGVPRRYRHLRRPDGSGQQEDAGHARGDRSMTAGSEDSPSPPSRLPPWPRSQPRRVPAAGRRRIAATPTIPRAT